VLDKQLQETVKQFEKTAAGAEDRQEHQATREALKDGAKIIVCTLQKFSWMRNFIGGRRN